MRQFYEGSSHLMWSITKNRLMLCVRWPFWGLIAFGLVCFASTPLLSWPFRSWLEQQRVAELGLGVLSLLWLLNRRTLPVSPHVGRLLILLFAAGLLSSLLASHPDWALHEWSKSLGLFALLLLVTELGRQSVVVHRLLFLASCVAVLLAVQFGIAYLAAMFDGHHALDPYRLYPGFDWPRFYGQALVMFCPLLLVARSVVPVRWQLPWAHTLHVVHVLQWAFLIALDGRGSWLAAAISAAILYFFAQLSSAAKPRKLILRYLSAAALGLLLYVVLFQLLPSVLGRTTAPPSGLRTGLSGREVIWAQAVQMAREHLWLGAGPLHFSAVWNAVAAHPHQVALQWAAEWGLPAALLMLFLCFFGLWRGLVFVVRSPQASELDAALWLALCSAFLLAQVDGVFIMPYTEGWLAILAGLALSRWRTDLPWTLQGWRWPVGVLSLLALACLIFILVYEVPRLNEMQDNFLSTETIKGRPRFWSQGWIPMKLWP